ncbi:hypothetical protein ABT081_02280 [Streptomyces sp. NPDC002238]|uniref:hypothetical protein n=1 Tax=Streptomyces sp. NPDC002238 TaxID=3156649 RepID=UPI003332D26A
MPPDPTLLTTAQRAAVEFAQQDLAAARSADLAELGEAGLILTVERLRGRLDEVLSVLGEIAR